MSFRKGDKVKCIKVQFGNETLGKVYEVRENYDYCNWLKILKDDDGGPNSYRVENFKLVKREKFYK